MILPMARAHLLDLHGFWSAAWNLLAPAGEATTIGENLRLRRLPDIDAPGDQLLPVRRALLPVLRVRPWGGELLCAVFGVRP